LRISEAMLNTALENRLYDRETDVRDTILGTAVTGRARIVGQPRAQLIPSADRATFNLIFEGTVCSRTIGYNGPAILRSRGETRFTATRQIVFEPGKGYSALPPQISTSTKLFSEGIGSTRRGIVGLIVRRRAARLEMEQRPQATAIVRQKTERRILATFDRATDEHLARLNDSQSRSVGALVVRLLGKEKPVYACCTSPHYLQIAAHLDGQDQVAFSLPSQTAQEHSSLLQIWLPDTLLRPGVAATLNALQSPGKVGEFLAEVLPVGPNAKDESPEPGPLATFLNQQAIHVRQTGEWRVIALTKPDAARPLAAAASRSPAAVRQSGPRTWTSGKYTAEAEFLALEDGVVRLRRVTGVNASIPLQKLSTLDQQWIAAHLAGK
jgi:hypothetical protein